MTHPIGQIVDQLAERMGEPCPEGIRRLNDDDGNGALLSALAQIPDAVLMAAYHRMDGDCSRSQVLRDEIERRHLDY